MIPDYQTLMRPVLEAAESGEVKTADVVDRLADQFRLSADERSQLLPSGTQPIFSNRVNWAKTYLKQAGLVRYPRRAYFEITDRGRQALASGEPINTPFLERFPEFMEFKNRTRTPAASDPDTVTVADTHTTPDEQLRQAFQSINNSLAQELLDKARASTPAFFEKLIVELLLAMGYGGTSEDAGRALGRSGDDGVDGVIDQDPLGVDQVYVQAKRYADGNAIGPGAIRDFFGALSLKKAQKGIFVTTSNFTASAIETAQNLGSRIVLIDGAQLARLMIRYGIGCREEEILRLMKVDEDFFE